jgi:acyl transferase domain-containing protein
MRPMMPAVPDFPVTAIASVGASCRLPGANDQEEVWQLVSEERDFTNGIQQAG